MKSRYLIVLVLPVALQCNDGGGIERKQSATAVRLAQVRYGIYSRPVEASGVLSAARSARLSFAIGGIIDHIPVREGQRVRKDQILAQLKMEAIDASLQQAISALEKARRDHNRAASLYADSVITLEQVQNAETALDVAQAGVEIARFNREHAAIFAPADGIILKKFNEPDELVAAGQPVLYFGRSQEDWVLRVGVSARDIIRLRIGDSATVLFRDAYPDRNFPARVTEIAEAADPAICTYEVELSVDSQKCKMVSGFIGRATLHPSAAEPVIMIPIEALIEADGRDGFVFSPAADSASVRKIPVRIGQITEDGVIIVSGLRDTSATVVIEGAAYLFDGAPIRVLSQ